MLWKYRRQLAAGLLAVSIAASSGCGCGKKPPAGETQESVAAADTAAAQETAQGHPELVAPYATRGGGTEESETPPESFYEEEESGDESYREYSAKADGLNIISSEDGYDIRDCVTLPDLSGITLSAADAAMTEEEIEKEALTSLLLDGEANLLEEDDPQAQVRAGDKICVEMELTAEGLDPWYCDTVFIDVGDGMTGEEIEDAALGMRIGAEKEIGITHVPADLNADIPDGPAECRMKLLQIARAPEPSEAELRKRMKEIRDAMAYSDETARLYELKEILVDGAQVTGYPDDIIADLGTDYDLGKIVYAGSIDDYLSETGLTMEEYREDKDAYILEHIRERTVMDALIKESGVTTEDPGIKEQVTADADADARGILEEAALSWAAAKTAGVQGGKAENKD